MKRVIMPMLLSLLLLLPVASASAPSIVVGQTSIASALDPLNGSNGWYLTSHGVSESIYRLDRDGRLISRFVRQAEQSDDYTWSLALNEGVYFSDGTEVDAEAFSRAVNLLMEENLYAPTGGAGVMHCEPTDTYALTLTTEKVTRVLPCNLCEWSMVLFKPLDDGSFAFTGPYVAVELVPNVRISLAPNPFYPDADARGDIAVLAFEDSSAMMLAFEAGELDLASTITADVVEMLELQGLKTQTFDAGYQYFVQCNTAREIVSDPVVRRALNCALDRETMLTVLKGGRVATGLFANYYSFAGDCATAYEPERAKALLDEAGWLVGADGVREKDGRPLSLHLITYASRPDLPTLMQIAVSQLEEIGVMCTAEVVSNVTERAAEGDFDLLFYAQHTAPTGDPAYYLNMAFRAGAASNYSRYADADFEALLDEMGALPLGEQRDRLAKQAQAKLYEDLPVLYLIDPQWHIAVSNALEGYAPYCGDYYTIDADLRARG